MCGNGIDVRGWYVFAPVKSHIRIAEIVGHNDHEMGMLRAKCSVSKSAEQECNAYFHHESEYPDLVEIFQWNKWCYSYLKANVPAFEMFFMRGLICGDLEIDLWRVSNLFLIFLNFTVEKRVARQE